MDYQSSIEDIDAVTKRIKVTIPDKVVGSQVEGQLALTAKRVALKGFRAGKAPLDMVRKSHGADVRAQVVDRVISDSLTEIFQKHKLETVGYPSIEFGANEVGKDLQFSASVSIFPRPEVKDWKGIDVEVLKRDVPDSAVEGVITDLRKGRATVKKVEGRDAVQAGDVLEMLVAIITDPTKEVKAEAATVPMGDGYLPAAIEEQLVGAKIGETRALEGEPPAALRRNAPEKVQYRIEIKAISERILPELDDALAKSVYEDTPTVLELRLKVRKQLEERVAEIMQGETEASVVRELVKRNPFPVPQVLIDEEIRSMLERQGFGRSGKFDLRRMSMEPFRAAVGEQALERVRAAVLVDTIVKQEKLVASDEDISAWVEKTYQENQIEKEQLQHMLQHEEHRAGIVGDISRTKALKLIVQHAKVKQVEKLSEAEGGEGAASDGKKAKKSKKADKGASDKA